jgi:probable HAF family extracellular repeat protein
MNSRSVLKAVLVIMCAVPAFAANLLYSVEQVGSLGGTTILGRSTVATALNDSGQVTGLSYIPAADGYATIYHAFLYTNHAITDLGTLPGLFSYQSAGFAINAAGQVTGSSLNAAQNAQHAFLNSNGIMTDIGTLGGSSSRGIGINDSGSITGQSFTRRPQDGADVGPYAFYYSGGVFTNIGTLGGNVFSWGSAINNAGQITGVSSTADGGNRAFLYQNGTLMDLGTLGGRYSDGLAINSRGEVTGSAGNNGNNAQHAFLFRNGAMEDLGTLGGVSSTGMGINDSGQITGSSYIPGNTDQHAFIYSDGFMTDLNALIDPALGITLTEGRGINVLGQIVANGAINASGVQEGFLLTPLQPVPEPSAFALFVVAIGMVRFVWPRL